MAVRRNLVMRSVVNRRLVLLSLTAMAILGLAACNSTTTGTPQPTVDTTTQGTGGTGSDTTSGGSNGTSLAAIQPCDLLDASTQSRFGLSKADSIPVAGARPCTWSKSVDANGENGYTVEIDIRDQQGLQDVNTSGFTVTQHNVGSHQGKQVQLNAGGTCLVVLGVGDSSRVDVGVTAGTDTAKACQLAGQLATVVEPQLPSGS
jgi:hypothetical protein